MICAPDNCHSSLLSTHLSCLLHRHTFATGSSRQMWFSFLNTERGGDFYFYFIFIFSCYIGLFYQRRECRGGISISFKVGGPRMEGFALGLGVQTTPCVCSADATVVPQQGQRWFWWKQKAIKPRGKRESNSLRESQMIPHGHLWALV